MSERKIMTRQIFTKWHAYCPCGGYWSGEHDTEAEAVDSIKSAMAGNCQCNSDAGSQA
jgi:hypothetical protein